MAAYFNLNDNEISKELLVNKFNMILENQGRLALNDQCIRHTMNHEDLLRFFRSTQQRCSVEKGTLKNSANFTEKHLCWSLFSIERDSTTGVFL